MGSADRQVGHGLRDAVHQQVALEILRSLKPADSASAGDETAGRGACLSSSWPLHPLSYRRPRRVVAPQWPDLPAGRCPWANPTSVRGSTPLPDWNPPLARQLRRRRRPGLIAGGIGLALRNIAVTLDFAIRPAPRLVWNASASAPIGLWRIQPDIFATTLRLLNRLAIPLSSTVSTEHRMGHRIIRV